MRCFHGRGVARDHVVVLRASILLACLLCSGSTGAEEPTANELFGGVATPATGFHPPAIGGYAKGCLAGGEALPSDGPADVESRPPALFPPYLDIGPVQAGRCAECLGERLLRREAGGQRSQRHAGLGSGEQALAQPGRPGERGTETLDVDHVHAYADDHGLITGRR